MPRTPHNSLNLRWNKNSFSDKIKAQGAPIQMIIYRIVTFKYKFHSLRYLGSRVFFSLLWIFAYRMLNIHQNWEQHYLLSLFLFLADAKVQWGQTSVALVLFWISLSYTPSEGVEKWSQREFIPEEDTSPTLSPREGRVSLSPRLVGPVCTHHKP